LNRIGHKKEARKKEMPLGASTREVEQAIITISDVNSKCSMPVEVTEEGDLLFQENVKYQELIAKSLLPVHIILGAGSALNRDCTEDRCAWSACG